MKTMAFKPITLGGKKVALNRAARDLQMDPGHLSRILSGTHDPRNVRCGIMLDLAKYFQFAVEDLITAIDARRSGTEEDLPSLLCDECGGRGLIPQCSVCGLSTDVRSIAGASTRRARAASV